MNRPAGIVPRALGRLGGLSVMGGWLLLAATAVIAATGGSVGIGGQAIGSLIFTAAVILVAIGTTAIAVGGPRPFQSRVVRLSLGVLAVGLMSATAGTLIAAASAGDPLENGPVLILLLGGGLVVGVGTLATVLSLLRRPGPTRTLALMFLGGLLAAWVAGILVNTLAVVGPLHVLAQVLAIGGGAGVAAAGAGIGVLAFRGTRALAVVPA
jgi:hypothetical protein